MTCLTLPLMRFGVFIPQGWRFDLVGIDDSRQWPVMRDLARRAAAHGGASKPTGAGGGAISLEPGGQFELSGAPLKDIHDICSETGQHLVEVKMVADELDLGFLGVGFDLNWRLIDSLRPLD